MDGKEKCRRKKWNDAGKLHSERRIRTPPKSNGKQNAQIKINRTPIYFSNFAIQLSFLIEKLAQENTQPLHII